jgi:hypothetical protein
MSPDVIREYLHYQDGAMIWRKKTGCKTVVGRAAGSKRPDGYVIIRLCGRSDYMHRIVWRWHFGEIPAGLVVDHIDRNPSNNRIENLRLLTHKQNHVNAGPQRNNTSGFRGVYAQSGKFNAMFRQRHLGRFASAEEAAEAYDREASAFIAPGGV